MDSQTPVFVGIDVAKDTHWVTVLTDTGDILQDHALANTPPALEAFVAQLATGLQPRLIGVDMLGGIATLLVATLLAAGETVVHVAGHSVHRARRGFHGGTHKSDAKDARVIADQVRTRHRELRTITLDADATAAIRLLVTRRRVLTVEQTRRLTQLHDVLVQVHPGLDRVLALKHRRAGLYLLTRFVTPHELRTAGVDTVQQWLRTSPYRLIKTRMLAERALAAATEQTITLPGEAMAAVICRDLAAEALGAMDKIETIDADLTTRLAVHPEAALIQSLPGMGVVLTAEFLAHAGSITRYPSADHLAAAAGLAPVLHQTGRTRYVSRPRGGNKALKRVCYQSALVAVRYHALSRAYYERKRRAGKRPVQALIALARRRVNVLYAMLRDATPYVDPLPLAA